MIVKHVKVKERGGVGYERKPSVVYRLRRKITLTGGYVILRYMMLQTE